MLEFVSMVLEKESLLKVTILKFTEANFCGMNPLDLVSLLVMAISIKASGTWAKKMDSLSALILKVKSLTNYGKLFQEKKIPTVV